MRRDQLEHAIQTACQIIERPEVIVVGSQAILGSFREDELPADATMSVEVDILPIADSNDETARLAARAVAAGLEESVDVQVAEVTDAWIPTRSRGTFNAGREPGGGVQLGLSDIDVDTLLLAGAPEAIKPQPLPDGARNGEIHPLGVVASRRSAAAHSAGSPPVRFCSQHCEPGC
jgi:hypothetical protein